MSTPKGEHEGGCTGWNNWHSPYKRGSDTACLPLSHVLNYTRTVCSTNEADPGWMHDIAKYLQMGELPEDEKQTYKLRM